MIPSLDGIRLVSWDVDGTLYSMRAVRRALWRVAFARIREVGGPQTFRDMRAIRAYRALVERQRGDGHAVPVPLELLELYTVRALAFVKPDPRAVALLRHIQSLRIPQVVLSDYDARAKVDCLGLSPHFTGIYNCQALGAWKPSPTPFLHIQNKHSALPGMHLHIGDRLDTDGAGARQSGCHFLHWLP